MAKRWNTLRTVGAGIAGALAGFFCQQLENYVLSPRITAKTMELHPAIAFGSAMVGAAVAGPIDSSETGGGGQPDR